MQSATPIVMTVAARPLLPRNAFLSRRLSGKSMKASRNAQ